MSTGEVIREVSAQITRLAPLDCADLTDQQLLDGVATIVTARAIVDGLLSRLVSHTDRRELAAVLGAPSTAAWLSGSGRLDPGPAKRVVNTALALDRLPYATAALRIGDITAEHASAIAAAIDALDTACPDLDSTAREVAEETLVALALTASPAMVAKRGSELLLALVPPELDATASEDPSRNRVTVSRKRNGRTGISGDLDVESAEKLLTALSGVSKPRPTLDGSPDPRDPAQRRADGFVEILDAYLGCGLGPGEGSVKPHLTLTASARDLARGGHCEGCTCANVNSVPADRGAYDAMFGADYRIQLAWMGPFSTEAARLLACDCDVTKIMLDDSEVPLNLGRTERLITPGLRKALVVRDQGCAMPGCGRPAAWCHGHHIQHWIDGGTTDLANLVVLCAHHHRVIHKGHWQVFIGQDNHPWFIPPEWIDKQRRPLPAHNRTHVNGVAA